MCDGARAADRPRWLGLYAIAALAGLALLLVSLLPLAPRPLAAMRVGLLAAGFGAMAWWLHANRTALDLADWCECASASVTVRIIAAPAVLSGAPESEAESEPAAEPALH